MMRWATTLLLAALLAAFRSAAADLLLLDEDFSPFSGTGLAPVDAGALDSRRWAVLGLSDGDSAFGDTRTGGDFARGTSAGGERSGGLYAFDLPGSLRGVGVQATGSDFTPGSLLRRVQNTAGVALDGLLVLFDLWVLNDGERSTRILFDAHADPGLTAGRGDDAATRITPAAADALGWQPLAVRASILGLDIRERGEVILRWLFEDAGVYLRLDGLETGQRRHLGSAGMRQRVTAGARHRGARGARGAGDVRPLRGRPRAVPGAPGAGLRGPAVTHR